MTLFAGYCPVRYGIEIRQSNLANALANAAARLMRLVGRDRAAFALARQECVDLRDEIELCRGEFDEHCCEHGC